MESKTDPFSDGKFRFYICNDIFVMFERTGVSANLENVIKTTTAAVSQSASSNSRNLHLLTPQIKDNNSILQTLHR